MASKTKPTYIYLFENGDVGISDTEPTQEDLNCIEDGILRVLRAENGPVMDVEPDRSLVKMEISQLVLDKAGSPQYHTV